MTGILNLITSQFNTINFYNPLTYIDLILAVSLVLSFLIYLRRFAVFRVVLGVLFLLACSVIFFWIDFIFTSLVLGIASNLILISLPLIFAPEIRHYLEKLGRFPFLKLPKFTENQKKEAFTSDLVDACFELADKKIGGTIVIQRKTGLGRTIETGVILNAHFSSKLLQNIFFPKSPLHDGAVIIKNKRVYAAGCILQIDREVVLDPPFGTRHKSGLSITRFSDAVVLLISEQRGEVSLAENGKLNVGLKRPELIEKLTKLL